MKSKLFVFVYTLSMSIGSFATERTPTLNLIVPTTDLQRPINKSSFKVEPPHEQNLIQTLAQALQFDPNLKSAQINSGITQDQQAQAFGQILPQIEGNVNLSWNKRAGQFANNYKGNRYSVSLSQTLFDLPKFLNWWRYYTVIESTQAQEKSRLQALFYEVIERYFTVLEKNDSVALMKQEQHTLEKQYQQALRQFAQQRISITELYDIEAQRDSLIADVIGEQTRLDIARQNLAELTGQQIVNLSPLQSKIHFERLKGDINEWVKQAQQNNPSIIAKNLAINTAKQDILQQHSRHFPTIEAQLYYYNTNTAYQNAQTPTMEIQVASVNIMVPLFSGGSIYYAAQESAKKHALKQQERISLLRTLIKDTRDAFLSTNASILRIAAAKKAVQSAGKAREAMEKGMHFKMQTITDVLMAQIREFKAKRNVLQAKYAYIKHRSRFEQYTGTISMQYIELVNHWLK